MAKPRIWSQERMPVDIVPLPEKQGYDSFEELFDDPKCPVDRKLHILSMVSRFETLNGLRKADLHAMVKWLFNEHYEIVRQ